MPCFSKRVLHCTKNKASFHHGNPAERSKKILLKSQEAIIIFPPQTGKGISPSKHRLSKPSGTTSGSSPWSQNIVFPTATLNNTNVNSTPCSPTTFKKTLKCSSGEREREGGGEGGDTSEVRLASRKPDGFVVNKRQDMLNLIHISGRKYSSSMQPGLYTQNPLDR